jgi:hypothetical protein
MSKLRELMKGIDFSDCGTNLFWGDDGSPCCPLGKLMGPIRPVGPGESKFSGEYANLKQSTQIAFMDRHGISDAEFDDFWFHYDKYVNEGLSSNAAVERALDWMEDKDYYAK